MPPSIAIATPVLGGPGTMRVVLNSSSSMALVLGGPEVVRVVLNSSSSMVVDHVRERAMLLTFIDKPTTVVHGIGLG
jgi:hypothetical protein